MSGVEAFRPDGFQPGHEYGLAELLRGDYRPQTEQASTLPQRLMEAAVNFLQDAGIRIPYATLTVRDNQVVMNGAPQCGELLVCAAEGSNIVGYI